MTKTELIAAIASACNVSKRLAGDMVNCFVDTVIKGVKKDGEVRIQGFMTIKISHRKKRDGVNPRTGEKITIPAMKVPAAKFGKAFKEAVRK